ncbi:glycerol ethanol, ferric requiring protein [Aspergillus fumigatus]
MPGSSTAPRSPSVLSERRSWRLSGLSVTSPVDPSPPDDNGHPNAITDEIREIKRYEDFTTIDWVQDAIQEQARRRAKRRDGFGFWDQEGTFGWRRKVSESYHAGQAWLVITIVGAAIGLISAVLNIITEWLSDIKLGHCTTAFYLNEQFCCWGAEGGCPEWKPWTSFWLINYFVYFFFAVCWNLTWSFRING